jgi:hypothetical protein
VGEVESTLHVMNHTIDHLSASFHNFMGNYPHQHYQLPPNGGE